MNGGASRPCLKVSPAGGENPAWSIHRVAVERRRASPRVERIASLIHRSSQRRFMPGTFRLHAHQTRWYRFGVSITERCTKPATSFRRWTASGKASKSMRTNTGPFGGRMARHFHQAFRMVSISGGNSSTRSTRSSRLLRRERPVQGGSGLGMRGASRTDAKALDWFDTAHRHQVIQAPEPRISLETPKQDGRNRQNA